MFPQELIDATEYLQNRITACTSHSDGRLNSNTDETAIINELIDKYGSENVVAAPDRHWYDVLLFGYPVNIKSSRMTTSDNCNAVLAILHCFTNADLKCGWAHFYSSLSQRTDTDTDRNYYFLVLDKRDSSVHLQSLRTLARLTSNGNNLPFQIKWADNITPIERTYEAAYRFVIDMFKESVTKRMNVHNGYENL